MARVDSAMIKMVRSLRSCGVMPATDWHRESRHRVWRVPGRGPMRPTHSHPEVGAGTSREVSQNLPGGLHGERRQVLRTAKDRRPGQGASAQRHLGGGPGGCHRLTTEKLRNRQTLPARPCPDFPCFIRADFERNGCHGNIVLQDMVFGKFQQATGRIASVATSPPWWKHYRSWTAGVSASHESKDSQQKPT